MSDDGRHYRVVLYKLRKGRRLWCWRNVLDKESIPNHKRLMRRRFAGIRITVAMPRSKAYR